MESYVILLGSRALARGDGVLQCGKAALLHSRALARGEGVVRGEGGRVGGRGVYAVGEGRLTKHASEKHASSARQ